MGQAKFFVLGSVSRDSAFNAQLRELERANTLFGWLAPTWTKRQSTVSALEMPDFLWFNVEGIQKPREIGWQSGLVM